MRAVFDTNILISGLLWHGVPHALLEHVRQGDFDLISSPALLTELSNALGRAKFAAILARSNTSREQILVDIRPLVEVINPPPLPQPVCRDPDDDAVLALAHAGQATVVVSGDADLLHIGRYAGIAIVSAADALSLVQRR